MNKFAQVALDVVSDQPVVGNVLTGITDLSCQVQAFDKCYFMFSIIFSQSLLTDSIKIDLAYPSNPTSITYNIMIPAATIGVDSLIASVNRACSGTALISANTNYVATIQGALINGSNAGVLQPKVSSTGGLSTVTVVAGSNVVMTNL